MVDISMCTGEECPLKEKCYRYMAIPGLVQSFLLDVPYHDGDCEYFDKIQGRRVRGAYVEQEKHVNKEEI